MPDTPIIPNLKYSLEKDENGVYTMRLYKEDVEIKPLRITTENTAALLMYISGYVVMSEQNGVTFEIKGDNLSTITEVLTLYTMGLTTLVEWFTENTLKEESKVEEKPKRLKKKGKITDGNAL